MITRHFLKACHDSQQSSNHIGTRCIGHKVCSVGYETHTVGVFVIIAARFLFGRAESLFFRMLMNYEYVIFPPEQYTSNTAAAAARSTAFNA